MTPEHMALQEKLEHTQALLTALKFEFIKALAGNKMLLETIEKLTLGEEK